MFATIAMRIAAPMMMSKAKALIPCRVNPSCSTPSMMPPTSPPTIVPAPPAIAVPPMTPEATPRNMIVAAARQRIGRADAERLQQAGEPAQGAGQDEIADLDAVDGDAGLGRGDDVAADRDRVQAPARMAQHDVHDRRRSATAQTISE